MKITAHKKIGQHARINGVDIRPGTRNYPLDSKDPVTIVQLNALREIGLISFDETITEESLADATKALDNGDMEYKVETRLVNESKGKKKKLAPRNFVIESDTPKTKELKAKAKEETKKDVRRSAKSTRKTVKDDD